MSKFEYRVIWQRAGHPRRRAIYQTLAGAEACVTRQRTARDEMAEWATVDEIVFGPIVLQREVGPWEEKP